MSKIKEKGTQYVIAISIILIVFISIPITRDIIGLEENALFYTILKFILNVCLYYIYALFFKDFRFYDKKYQYIVLESNFIIVKNIIFIVTIILIVITAFLKEFVCSDTINNSFGMVMIGVFLQGINFEIRKDYALKIKITIVILLTLLTMLILLASVASYFN